MSGVGAGATSAKAPLRPFIGRDSNAGAFIQFHELAVRMGGQTILEKLSLGIAAGEFVCLLGPSGCGKSTLLRILGGLLQPSAGTITVGGQSPEAVWNTVAFVFQSPRLVPWRNAIDNAALGLELRKPEVSKAERRQRASELLSAVGLANDLHKFPAMLSGGERQRVAIARALVVDPEIVLMDEPFSALDPETRRRMRADLVTLWQSTQKTIVFVTHDIDEAIELADRIVVLSNKPTRILDQIQIGAVRPRRMENSDEIAATRSRLHALFLSSPAQPGGLL